MQDRKKQKQFDFGNTFLSIYNFRKFHSHTRIRMQPAADSLLDVCYQIKVSSWHPISVGGLICNPVVYFTGNRRKWNYNIWNILNFAIVCAFVYFPIEMQGHWNQNCKSQVDDCYCVVFHIQYTWISIWKAEEEDEEEADETLSTFHQINQPMTDLSGPTRPTRAQTSYSANTEVELLQIIVKGAFSVETWLLCTFF